MKTGKCAGTTIETFLSGQVCGPKDVCTGVSPKPPGHVTRNPGGWREHDDVIKVKTQLPNVFKDYFIISVERNPWDKAVSQYCHHAAIQRQNPEQFRQYLMGKPFGNWSKNGRRKYSIDNVVVVDYVIKYHKLQQELEHITHNILKLDIPVQLVNAKGNHRKNKGDYTVWYTDQEMIDRIADLYAWDIKTFGWTYGGEFREIAK